MLLFPQNTPSSLCNLHIAQMNLCRIFFKTYRKSYILSLKGELKRASYSPFHVVVILITLQKPVISGYSGQLFDYSGPSSILNAGHLRNPQLTHSKNNQQQWQRCMWASWVSMSLKTQCGSVERPSQQHTNSII